MDPARKALGGALLSSTNGANVIIRLYPFIVLVASGCASTATLRQADAPPDISGMFRAGGQSLYIHCRGSGSPTVIFDSGAGTTSSEWDSIGAAVSRHTRVCAYDRAGLGRSEHPVSAPTAQRRATDLRSLLDAADIRAPVILAGHSAGGMIALAFAAQYPRDVVGLVLIDAAPVRALGKLQKTLDPQQWSAFANLIAERREGWTAEAFLQSEKWLQQQKFDLRLPMVVLSRGIPLQAPPVSVWPAELGSPWNAIEEAWQDGQRELVRLSRHAQHRIASESGHNIQRAQPRLVVEAVMDVLGRARGR